VAGYLKGVFLTVQFIDFEIVHVVEVDQYPNVIHVEGTK